MLTLQLPQAMTLPHRWHCKKCDSGPIEKNQALSIRGEVLLSASISEGASRTGS